MILEFEHYPGCQQAMYCTPADILKTLQTSLFLGSYTLYVQFQVSLIWHGMCCNDALFIQHSTSRQIVL